MKYKIGFITTKYFPNDSFCELIKTIIDICEIDFLEFESNYSEEKLLKLYKKNIHKYDAFVCSGVVPYSIIVNSMKRDDSEIPLGFLCLSERDFYKYIFEILVNNRNLDFSKVFIDFLRYDNNYYDIYSVFKEKNLPYTIKDFDIKQPVQNFLDENNKLFDIHSRLWKENKINLSITRNYVLHKQLKALGYNCIYMIPSNDSILDTFKDVLNKLDINKLNNNKIATCFITLNTDEYNYEKLIFEYDDILEKLYNTISELLIKNNLHNIQIIKKSLRIEMHTTRDTLSSITNGYKNFFMEDILNRLYFGINIGWGIGNTKIISENNAKNANIKSSQIGGNCTFIIDESNNIIGPLKPQKNEIVAPNQVISYKLSNYIPLSSLNISKILFIINERDSNIITGKILSDYLNVTLRSANRILNILCESNAATVIETKNNKKHKGRPEKLYKVDFKKILDNMPKKDV